MRASHKRFLMTAVMPVALLGSMAAQCGPDNSDPSAPATATAAPTGTAAPAGTAAPGGTAAPTGTAAPAGTTAPTGKPGPVKALSNDELTKAMLTKADVPGTTNSETRPAGGDSKDVADKPECQPVLDLIDTMNAATKPTAAVEGMFKTGSGGVMVVLNQFGAGQGEKAMSSAAAALGSCPSIPSTVPGNGNSKSTMSVSKLSYSTLGDATLAFKVSFATESAAGEYSYVFVRSGDAVINISNVAKGSVPQPDQAVVKKQLDLLKAAQQH
ncbi:hypothetical protein [Kitasatospora sp. NPDC047058]|uniref:hypothetical protein n=1 Tax=Kitasatospora sp. NPDC047058 TaxID=3155620 RepID=UPI00340A681D